MSTQLIRTDLGTYRDLSPVHYKLVGFKNGNAERLLCDTHSIFE